MRRFCSGLTLMLALAVGPAAAQPVPASTFSLRTVQPDLTQTFDPGGTLAFTSPGIGVSSDASVTVTYKPALTTLAVTVVSLDLNGSNDFTVTGLPDFSNGQLVLSKNVPSLAFVVHYRPSTSKAVTGKITLTFTEADTASVPAFKGQRTASVLLNLTGVAPEFAYTYAVQPNGNSTPLKTGDLIRLPAANLLDTAVVAITIANRGTAAGIINTITLSGPASFVLAGVPFPPISVDAGKSITFSVRYTPDQLDEAVAAVKIDFQVGPSLSFTVSGTGLGPEYLYELLTSNVATAIGTDTTIVLPDATVGGDKTQSTIRVTNVGNADARITAISASGNGFAVAEAPFLPYTAAAGTSFTVVVSFTPQQPGKSTGRLRIGADNFNLEAGTLGPNVTYSYTAGADAIAVLNAGTIVFTPTPVGGSATIRFTARNEGTSPSQISSISAAGTGTTFTADSLPGLPIRLDAGATATFVLTFTPVTLGANTGTLRIDTNTFTLSGVAGAPPPLPDYSFQGGTATVDAQQQPPIGLSLNTAYPLALTGTLTLSSVSDVFANDPAVQFASGGRTINFTIAANTRQAVFSNGSTQMRLQTGTVAGTIIVTPTFATASGGIDLTPATPPALSLRVPQSAPQLLSVGVAAKTTTGFTLQVTGYATGRSITQMDFQFTTTPGENVPITKLTMNVDSTFGAWYQSTASQAYGSLFTATIPFTLAGDLVNVKNTVDTVKSVSVTLTNGQGVSVTKSVDLQ
jgi:hypothetical protein